MNGQLDEMLAAARRDRQAGNRDAAERGYTSAAELARSQTQPLALAHALRHISDLARERGSFKEAAAAASEAVTIYRVQLDSHPVDLANALRLHALALAATGVDLGTLPLWKEARELYESAGISAGVKEAERQLARAR